MKKRLRIFMVVILLIASLTGCNNAKSKEDAYLPGLVELTDELENYQIYLVGEAHGISYTFTAELEMIKYFYYEQDVSNILLEMGYAAGLAVQRYLDTGDETYLKHIIETTEGTTAYTNEYYSFLQDLYQFNQSLPETKRLSVYGVDVEHQYDLGIWVLNENIQSTTDDEVLTELLLSSVSNTSVELVENVLLNFDKYKDLYGDFAGDAYKIIEGLLQRNITQSINFNEGFDKWLYAREEYFSQNVVSALDFVGEEKVITIFGGFHTNLSGQYCPNVADTIINRYGIDNVASFGLVYKDCSYLDGNNQVSIVSYDDLLARILSKQTDQDIHVFALSNLDTNSDISSYIKSYQYAVLIQNSPAMIEYGS